MTQCCGFLTVVLVVCMLSSCFSNQGTRGRSIRSTVTGSSLDHASSTQQDNTQIGIDNIVNIVRTIEEMSVSQLRSVLENDIKDGNKKSISHRVVRDAEYHPFFCDVYCFIQSTDESQEYMDERDITDTRKQHFMLECSRTKTSLTTVQRIPVTVDCVSHFTGSLIHIAFKLEQQQHKAQFANGTLTIGKKFASTLASVGHFDLSQLENTATGLYITLNVPITAITFEDLRPLKPWLRYIALNGEYLQSIDKNILSHLTLNYFVLEGCTRNEIAVDSTEDISYTIDSSVTNCKVLWRYSCGSTTTLDVWADSRTQSQFCGPHTVYRHVATQGEQRRRNRRSPRGRPHGMVDRNPPQIVRDTISPPMFTPSGYSIVEKPKHSISNSGLTERQDILWYRNVIILLVILLVLMVIILSLTLVALGVVIRRTLKEKLKPG